MNIFHFLVVKPWVWVETHLRGHKVEDSATAQIGALEQPIVTTLAGDFKGEVSTLIAESPNITEAEVNAALAPKADAIIQAAVSAVTAHLSGVSAVLVQQLSAYAQSQVPTLIADAYTELTKQAA